MQDICHHIAPLCTSVRLCALCPGSFAKDLCRRPSRCARNIYIRCDPQTHQRTAELFKQLSTVPKDKQHITKCQKDTLTKRSQTVDSAWFGFPLDSECSLSRRTKRSPLKSVLKFNIEIINRNHRSIRQHRWRCFELERN